MTTTSGQSRLFHEPGTPGPTFDEVVAPWTLDENLLEYDGYSIDLKTCTSSANVLDWIVQITHKSWASDEVISGLVHAFDALLHPQENLCSSGVDKRLTVDEIHQLVTTARRRF